MNLTPFLDPIPARSSTGAYMYSTKSTRPYFRSPLPRLSRYMECARPNLWGVSAAPLELKPVHDRSYRGMYRSRRVHARDLPTTGHLFAGGCCN